MCTLGPKAKCGGRENYVEFFFLFVLFLKSRFVHYFGGPCPHLGELLYRRLFSGAGTLNEETFIAVMKDFQRLSTSKKILKGLVICMCDV